MKRFNKNNRRDLNSVRNTFGGLESLESRQMYSANPFHIYTVPIGSGTELVCQMTAPSQQMSVVRSPNGIQFNLNGIIDDVAGNFSYLSIIAQSGNNSIVIGPNLLTPTCVWAGNGDDVISTGASNDDLRATGGDTTLIAMGGYNNQLFGGWGYTNAWYTDGNSYAQGSGHLVAHKISSFINTYDTALDGSRFEEPGTNTQSSVDVTWENGSFLPLFGANGPLVTDINQGACGDCYFLSTLAAIAHTDPQAIRNEITPLGDGTYAIEFYNNGTPEFVREDAYLPVDAYSGDPVYAKVGSDAGLWVALMEKGWAYAVSNAQGLAPDYGNIEGGYADPVYAALGANNVAGSFTNGTEEGTSMFGNSEYYFEGWINWQLEQGKAISLAFSNGSSSDGFSIPNILENNHEYTLISQTESRTGAITGYWVRNPWGIDIQDRNGHDELAAAGHNDGTDDGMVWVSVYEAWSVFSDIGAGTV